MATDVRSYFRSLQRGLHLDPLQETDILREIQSHVEERALELQEQGVPPEDALREALRDLGDPEDIAQGMYRTHARSSWRDAALASLPHILFSLFFALHLWSRVAWILLGFIAITLVSVRGWKRTRSSWIYPWLGYCLAAPVAVWFIAFLALGYGLWSFLTHGSVPFPAQLYLGMFLYLPLSLWAVAAIVVRVIRRDWLLATLMVLPFPFITTWLVFLQDQGGFLANNTKRLQDTDASTALGFLALALTTAIFCRLSQRLLRVGLLIIAAPVILALVLVSYQGGPNPFGMLMVSIVSLIFLLSPALLESKMTSKEEAREQREGRGLPGEQADQTI
ncbi:MAG: hypothetical protein HYX93_05380 [Chloroflexi bacterium]|nr:hypothetical protein [Chloroflexota bacterium]